MNNIRFDSDALPIPLLIITGWGQKCQSLA